MLLPLTMYQRTGISRLGSVQPAGCEHHGGSSLEVLNTITGMSLIKAAESHVLVAGSEARACRGKDSGKPNSREMCGIT